MNDSLRNQSTPETERTRLWPITLMAIGVVFGDIGTSPLYALRECFNATHAHALAVTPENILGLLSLLFWSLILIISVKYLMFVLRADNQGEGGILALLTLLTRERKDVSKTPHYALIALGLFGSTLLFGDGIITPAISVLSAVEGLNVATPAFQHWVIPISLLILALLFFLQHRGTASIGTLFGPILVVWFLSIAALGLTEIIRTPAVLAGLSPSHAVTFLLSSGYMGFAVLGIVFLALTGGEALYADIGHFGKAPIRRAWFCLVLPALLLNYFGQGALLMRSPSSTGNLFYQLAPPGLLYPLVCLATVATIIASQAIISGAFSLARQAVQLGYLPRMSVVHTSSKTIGQVYVPAVNWALLIGTFSLIVGFRESGNLANAYGIAVSATMLITTILTALVARRIWKAPVLPVVVLAAVFIFIEMGFFSSNVVKIRSGGWITVVIAGALYAIMVIWKRGREILRKNLESQALDLNVFLQDIGRHKPLRVPGVAVFLTGNPAGTPRTLLHNYKHNKIIHEKTVLLTIRTEEIPVVPADEKFATEAIGEGLYRVQISYGYSETPHVPDDLKMLHPFGMTFDDMKTTYFLGRETLIYTGKSGMRMWQKKLFAFLSHNALDATRFFHLPPNRVIELGLQVQL